MPHAPHDRRQVRFTDFTFDFHVSELRKHGFRLKIAGKPLDMLALLLDHPGEMVTREELQKRLWPNDTVVDFEVGVNAAIYRVRQMLGDDPETPRYIETLPRRGYRFIAPVEIIAAPPPGVPAGEPAVPPAPAIEPPSAEAELEGETTEPLGDLTGRTISHFRVLEQIGSGAMGVVFKAEDVRLGRMVALKFLPEQMAHDQMALRRFEREARAASALNHPNICTVYDIGEYEGQPFITMELLEGETLKERLGPVAAMSPSPDGGQRPPLQVGELLDLGIQVADVLDSAHSKGIIHRDIKPANIFLTTRGQAKVLDFGVAKLTRPLNSAIEERTEWEGAGVQAQSASVAIRDGTLTQAGSPIGTAAYMSPEQVRGEVLDARTDIFSFGAVLYEAATGRKAFPGETTEEVQQAILTHQPAWGRSVNLDLPEKLEEIIHRALEKDRELRYQHASDLRTELQRLKRDVESERSSPSSEGRAAPVHGAGRKLWKFMIPAAVILIAAAIGGTLHYRSRQATARMTDKDTIVLSDFINKTGESVFDDTLKQGLAVQLEQSPFLDLLSEQRVSETLKLMGRAAGDRMTAEVAREVCQRTGSTTLVTGSIAGLGSQYVIGVKAVNCNTGDVLAEAQEQAAGKEAVLKALDAAAVSLRSKLGESLSTVQKYATPVEEATTPSLEALKAYSMGQKMVYTRGYTEALPFFQRAVDIDPNFAKAYSSMAALYLVLNETGRAVENARKAYDLREKVSEPERFDIENNYYGAVGEMEKAVQTCKLWQQTFPRAYLPHMILGNVYCLGDWEKALKEYQEALRLGPHDMGNYFNLGVAYMALNRLDEAEAVFKQAEERGLETEFLPLCRYWLAFLKGDTAQMAQLVSAAMGKPLSEDLLLAAQADTEGWYGRLKSAHELTGRAMDSAQRGDAKERAAAYQALAALREVEAGNQKQARAEAQAAVKLAPNRDVRAIAALALARAGDTAGAEKLAAELDKAALVQRYWLPTIRAGVALARHDPNRAIEMLKTVSPIELGQLTDINSWLWPVYVRGEAYLMLRDGKSAAAEFQKFIDHRGVVMNSPWGALARLGLARAYALQGDTTKARAAYQDFLTLWKDADPDVPVLKEAKAEYARLK